MVNLINNTIKNLTTLVFCSEFYKFFCVFKKLSSIQKKKTLLYSSHKKLKIFMQLMIITTL